MDKISKDKYILPRIQLKDSLQQDEVENIFNTLGKYIKTFKELYSYNGLIVVGEPGNGKTRLLQELQNQAEQNAHSAIYLDLKKIAHSSIESQIEDSFGLNDSSTNLVVCLDALDEVKSENLYDCILKIKNFKIQYPKVKLVISCRSYVFIRYENLFSNLNLQLIEVKPFGPKDIRTYLSAYGVKENDINTILEHFSKNYKTEVINSPRILRILATLTEKHGTETTLKMTKAELLEEFIFEKIRIEDKDHKKSTELSKRVLEKIALTMEIYQSNEISKDELMTFFDDVDSNLSSNFLELISGPDESDRFLMPTTSDGKKIHFENAEYQEYLAAKEITRFGRVDQALFDIVIDKNTNEIYSSWGNTMKYVIELVPSILSQIIDFIVKKGTGANYELLNRILLSDKNAVERLLDDREKIFENVFTLHQNIQWHLKYDLVEKLSLYFTDKTEEIVKHHFTYSKNEVSLQNAIYLVEKLLELNLAKDIGFWKDKLLKKLNTTENENIKASIIKVLAQFKDLDIYKNNIDINKLNESSKYNLLRSCVKVNPNDPYSIDLIIDAVRNNNYNVYPSISFSDINSPEGIKYYLQKLISDEMLLSTFKVHPPEERFQDEIIGNIGKAFDNEIKELLTQIILLPSSNVEWDKLIKQFVKLLESKNPNLLFELIQYIKDNNLYPKDSFRLNQIFFLLLTPHNTERFISEMNSIDNKDRLLRLFWHSYSNSTNEEHKKIFEK